MKAVVNKRLESLHCHTRTSDGTLTYRALLDGAARAGFGVVAFTDHDALPDPTQRRELDGLRDHRVSFVSGIELSVSHIDDQPVPLCHLVGLFIDYENRKLAQYCKTQQAARVKRLKLMVSNLRRQGFRLSWEAVRRQSGGVALGRPHLVSALLADAANRRRLDELAAGCARRGQLVSSGPQRLYELLLTERALIKGVYVPYQAKFSLREAAELIHRAGGLAILAHWTFSKPVLSLSGLERLAKKGAVDGLEVVYGLNAEERLPELRADFQALEKVVSRTKLLRSGGADAHTRDDLEIFAVSPLAKKTIGMTAELIRKARPNLRWCSIKT